VLFQLLSVTHCPIHKEPSPEGSLREVWETDALRFEYFDARASVSLSTLQSAVQYAPHRATSIHATQVSNL
jgi:hypothetical protein